MYVDKDKGIDTGFGIDTATLSNAAKADLPPAISHGPPGHENTLWWAGHERSRLKGLRLQDWVLQVWALGF